MIFIIYFVCLKIKIYGYLGDKPRYDSLAELKAILNDDTITWRPRLIYGGFLFNRNYMSVCTTYVGKTLVASKSGKKLDAFAQALAQLHDKRIAHGDVRLPNLAWSDEKGTAAVLDFGFSERYDNDEQLEEAKKKDLENLERNLSII